MLSVLNTGKQLSNNFERIRFILGLFNYKITIMQIYLDNKIVFVLRSNPVCTYKDMNPPLIYNDLSIFLALKDLYLILIWKNLNPTLVCKDL